MNACGNGAGFIEVIRARTRRREKLSLLEISVVDQYWFESIEVNRPAFVDARRDGHRYLRPRELLATLAANLKPFLAIDPAGPLRVRDQALRSQHVVQAGNSQADWLGIGATFRREIPHQRWLT